MANFTGEVTVKAIIKYKVAMENIEGLSKVEEALKSPTSDFDIMDEELIQIEHVLYIDGDLDLDESEL